VNDTHQMTRIICMHASQHMRINRVFFSRSLPASGSGGGMGVGSESGSLCVSWSVSGRVCAR